MGPILAIGEVLWDSMPAGLFLGGAALNVAHDLNALGHETHLVSRVGRDFLGQELISRLRRWRMPEGGVTTSPSSPTGFVRVEVDSTGQPRFEIVEDVAWDEIEVPRTIRELAARARAVIYGTLAQRDPRSRAAIRSLWSAPGLMVCDVNLRPPFDDRGIVLESLEAADLLKVNHEELARIAAWLGAPAADERKSAEMIAARFELETLCVTRGASGAALLHAGEWHEHPGFRVKVIDTVGAGDAFLAGLLDARIAGEGPRGWLSWANRCGAFVAAAPGATPAMSRGSILEMPT